MKNVRPKKKLGQHFLTDLNIAKKIADLLDYSAHQNVLEIGPGTGVLTKYLVPKTAALHLIEVDEESIHFLQKKI